MKKVFISFILICGILFWQDLFGTGISIDSQQLKTKQFVEKLDVLKSKLKNTKWNTYIFKFNKIIPKFSKEKLNRIKGKLIKINFDNPKFFKYKDILLYLKIKINLELAKKSNLNELYVKKGDKITVIYTGSLKDGTIFDASSKHAKPLEFTAGIGKMIPGFDKGVIGMKLGELKRIEIPFIEAYGPLETQIPEEFFPKLKQAGLKKKDIKVGKNIIPKTKEVMEVIKIEGGKIYVKNPHPLAGKDLIFKVRVIEINGKTAK